MIGSMECGTVLIVEDNDVLLETFKYVVESEGYHVLTAKNGKEALAVLEVTPHPCLILLDMFMPVMDGWEFLNQIKLKEGDLIVSLPIVICSAAGEQKLAETAKEVSGYLKKPVDMDVLINTVKKFCNPIQKNNGATVSN